MPAYWGLTDKGSGLTDILPDWTDKRLILTDIQVKRTDKVDVTSDWKIGLVYYNAGFIYMLNFFKNHCCEIPIKLYRMLRSG
ncbi:hypothetical protein [Peribacillus sp. NPDC097295]|uniref:hypothetical protein n=1 Tax=Peribacillus sp. NPDC097295 TaxID=3364402 RepID=UPI003820842E